MDVDPSYYFAEQNPASVKFITTLFIFSVVYLFCLNHKWHFCTLFTILQENNVYNDTILLQIKVLFVIVHMQRILPPPLQ